MKREGRERREGRKNGNQRGTTRNRLEVIKGTQEKEICCSQTHKALTGYFQKQLIKSR